jgi:hypothetical protein
MARKAKVDHTPHIRLRIEPRLLDRLEKSREKEGRTLTGEIIHRLEQSFQKDERLDEARKAGLEVMQRAHQEHLELQQRTNRQFAALFLKLHESGLSNEAIKASLNEWLAETEQAMPWLRSGRGY